MQDAVVLGALVLVGAAWLFCHVAVLLRVARTRTLPLWLRLLAWLPPMTPFAGWRAGARVGPIVWAALGLGYVALRRLA